MSRSAPFAVNGRFLTQPVTGVQRYARNVVAAMNEALIARGMNVPLLAPLAAEDLHLSSMPLTRVGPMNGHVWEQVVLPMAWTGGLLNLGNTAPLAKSDQVVCIHDANIFTAPESYSAAFRTGYAAMHRALARRARRITTVSQFSAQQIARHLAIDARAIAVLPNGHEHALDWDPSRAETAPALLQQVDGPFVLALGSRARHKNMQLLLAAAPALAEMGVSVVIAGGGAGIFAAEELPSSANVRVAGYVSDHDLAFLMQKALCLVFPSWTEGFGLPIVEAMARGCPVISSDRASMPEICGDAALMAPPDDMSKWIDAIDRLLRSEATRASLITRGFERVRLFSWKDTATGYLDLMSEPSVQRSASRMTQPPKIAVVIATLGRPAIVSRTLQHLLETQTLRPAEVIVSCVSAGDAGSAAELPGVKVLTGKPGLPAQRNTALDALPPDIDIVVFFDDDFVADPGWLQAAADAFAAEADLAAYTGDVLADDIKGPGLSFDEALGIVNGATSKPAWSRIEPYSPYGCNMAFRRSAIGSLRFDERLVMYGWLEDRDFGGALARNGGRLVKCAKARGVHMGVKSGRVAGERLGYSQVVNPVYLLKKRTMTLDQVVRHISRNILSNMAKALKPEPFIDRRGRLRGNLKGFADVLRGRLEPERAVGITPAKTV